MGRRSLSRSQVREVDRCAIDDYGIPGAVLMENAGRGAAEILIAAGIGGRVVIVAGGGNNGGDGFVMARHLDNHGCAVRVLLACDPDRLPHDAAVNLNIIRKSAIPIDQLPGPAAPVSTEIEIPPGTDWIVDALLGTGTKGRIRDEAAAVINAINASAAKTLSVDLPSGLDCDTGEPLGPTVRANVTVSFVARKLGFDNPRSRDFTGDVHVADIGAPHRIIECLASA